MVGFGPEDDHFVAELTYNYGVGEYQLGNDFLVGESSFRHCTEVNSIYMLHEPWKNDIVIHALALGPHPAVKPSCQQC